MSAKFHKRYEAVFLCNHMKGPKLDYATAARQLQVSEDFVRRWVECFKATNNVDDQPGQDIDKDEEDTAIVQLFERCPNLTLVQGKVKLAQKGIFVSTNTIRHRLAESNIPYKSIRINRMLSKKEIETRKKWAEENIHRDWSKVIFSGETSFITWVPKKHSLTSKLRQHSVKHAVKINVWGCFSVHGFGSLVMFTDNPKAAKIIQIYEKALLKSATRWYRDNRDAWVLQEYNNYHQNDLCIQWKEKNNIGTLESLPNSADVNPFENLWRFLKIKLKGKHMQSLAQFTHHLRELWRGLSSEYAEKLVESMPERCEAIIDNNGDWTLLPGELTLTHNVISKIH